jgi:hypothetical protein
MALERLFSFGGRKAFTFDLISGRKKSIMMVIVGEEVMIGKGKGEGEGRGGEGREERKASSWPT